MTETLYEMAKRFTDEFCERRTCIGCPEMPHRDEYGACLVLHLAGVDNCDEQIERLKSWAESTRSWSVRAGTSISRRRFQITCVGFAR